MSISSATTGAGVFSAPEPLDATATGASLGVSTEASQLTLAVLGPAPQAKGGPQPASVVGTYSAKEASAATAASPASFAILMRPSEFRGTGSPLVRPASSTGPSGGPS